MRTLVLAVVTVVAFAAPCALPVPADAGTPALLAEARYVALG